MRARPGRLLPSVIVGGLLASGLALGAGTASAADTCKYEDKIYEIVDASKVTKDGDGCKPAGGLLSSLLGSALKLVAPPGGPGGDDADGGGVVEPGGTGGQTGGENSGGAGAGPSTKPSPSASATPTPTNTPAPAPAFVAAPVGVLPAPGPAPALGAAGPVGALPPLAGIAPPGLATGLFGANNYDPGLLFGSPLGDAASALFNPKADSDVTTVSQAQVLGSSNGSGYGTPVTIGVIILACLIGFAVRHRIISRMKARELPVDYSPRHAAPEPETELVEAPADARTMVVLTPR
ncbi:hypothetical protein WCD74_00005 [Actinomycetospora sp. OC33-EN08]|uniref:Uncharacterized protein n=1 Tax=Actinomycetospora aurantiaca TaxID=3129233 RepID=A0ABU8MI42_9PSEU